MAYKSEYNHGHCEHDDSDVDVAACDMDSLIDDIAMLFDANDSYATATELDVRRYIDRMRAAWAVLSQPGKAAENMYADPVQQPSIWGIPDGVRWNAERGHYEEEVCLGCGAATRLRDCGCPAGTGWRRWSPPTPTSEGGEG